MPEPGFHQHPLRCGIGGISRGKDTNYRGICEHPLHGLPDGRRHHAPPRQRLESQKPISAPKRSTSIPGTNSTPPTDLPSAKTAKSSGRKQARSSGIKLPPRENRPIGNRKPPPGNRTAGQRCPADEGQRFDRRDFFFSCRSRARRSSRTRRCVRRNV